MIAKPIELKWHPGLPIFASEAFLKAVGDEYGWIGGFNNSEKLRCILPYTIIKKAFVRMVRFRVETIPIVKDLEVDDEKSFLNSAIKYFRSVGADIIIPATTNTIFQTYPDGADAAPYGSYIVNLCESEDILWKNINRIQRQNINKARRNGVNIQGGIEYLDVSYKIIYDTFKRSKLPFMSYDSFKHFVFGLGEYGKIIIADYQGIAQSCTVYAFSNYCVYAVYGGNISQAHKGTMKLLQWEAIRLFKKLGVQRFDFVGARIDPEKGSKQEAINSFKRRLGGKLRQGYMWKYSLRAIKSIAYTLAVRYLRGGDIVDRERHKLKEAQQ